MIEAQTIEELKQHNFWGFERIAEMQSNHCANVPPLPGVYLVVRERNSQFEFLPESVGGWHKGRNPSVNSPVLKDAWVDGTIILYIGKAGGGKSLATLQKRLRAYMRFGEGKPVAHWGGRFIWQLKDWRKLRVCWRPMPDGDAEILEKMLIQEFKARYVKRPFANLRD